MLGLQKKRIIPIVLVSVGHYCSCGTMQDYHEAAAGVNRKEIKKN